MLGDVDQTGGDARVMDVGDASDALLDAPMGAGALAVVQDVAEPPAMGAPARQRSAVAVQTLVQTPNDEFIPTFDWKVGNDLWKPPGTCACPKADEGERAGDACIGIDLVHTRCPC